MGLMDRDYLRDQRDQRRQRPFSPPPQRSGTWVLALIFLAVLFSLYKMVDWKHQQRADALRTHRPSKEKVITPNSAAPQAFMPPPTPQSTPDASAGTQLVTKCVTNGKTSYGDGSCAQGAVVSQVRTRSNHHLMAAVRPEPLALAATEARISRRTVVAQDNRGAYAAAAKKAECEFLEEQISYVKFSWSANGIRLSLLNL